LRVVKEGHEVGIHGWIHELNSELGLADERDLMKRSFDTLAKTTGKPPVGMRTPSWDFSQHTLTLVRELGLLYDSSLMADDEPYELLEDGEPTGVVELPVEWIKDDAPYMNMVRHGAIRPHTPPSGVLSIFKSEFDMRAAGTWDESAQTETTTICAYCGVGCNLTLHVQANDIVKVTSPHDNPVTHGNLCIKGRFGFQHVQNRE